MPISGPLNSTIMINQGSVSVAAKEIIIGSGGTITDLGNGTVEIEGFGGGGGGSFDNINDGVTTVTPVVELRFNGGTITDFGSGIAEFSGLVDWNAGTVNALGNGLTLAAGTLSVSEAASPFKQNTATLTSADIIGLNSVAVTLAAAPGPGLFNRLTNLSITFQNNTAAYTGGGGTAVFYNNKSGQVTTSVFATVFQLATDRTISNIVNSTATLTPAQMENLPLVIQSPTAFAGGDGTALITLDYLTLPAS